MTKSFALLSAACTVALAAGCQKDNTPIKTTSGDSVSVSSPADSAQRRGHSLVRVVNAVNGGKDVAVFLDDQSLFADVKAGSVTDYREIATNLAKFSVRTPGDTTGMRLAEKDRMLLDGNSYTIVLIAEDVSKNMLRVVHDDVIPDSGKARLRVLHAAPGGPALDVSIVGSTEKLFSGVAFKDEAGFKDLTPAVVTLELRAKGAAKVLMKIPNVTLKRGVATTIVLTGSNKLEYFMFTDAVMPRTPKT
ncbi:MAG: DUF4397 domain-containing protein [Proteobacteria bacterium]|nr:DUF4397 domain-containing protein [Pseudomonadota bacterium]